MGRNLPRSELALHAAGIPLPGTVLARDVRRWINTSLKGAVFFKMTPLTSTIGLWLLVLAPGQQEPITGEQLAARLETVDVLTARDFDTTFELRILNAQPRTDELTWDTSDWLALEEFRYLVVGDQMRVERRAFKKSPLPNDATHLEIEYECVNIWSQGAWWFRVEGDPSVTMYAQAVPTDLYGKGFVFNLMQDRYPFPSSMADLVREGDVIEQHRDGGILTHRFAQIGMPANTVQNVLRASLEPVFCQIDYTTEVSSASDVKDFSPDMYHSQVYLVGEWELMENLMLPKVAYVDTSVRKDKFLRVSPFRQNRAIYTRKSFKTISKPTDELAQLFVMSMPVGTGVYDDRMKLSFKIGEKYIHLDGKMYELNEPLMEPPGDRLAELLKGATLVSPRAGVTPPTGVSDTPSLNQRQAELIESNVTPVTPGFSLTRKILVTVIVGVGVALLAVAFLHRTRIKRLDS